MNRFGETARGLSQNPLGIIALFIVLVYGFASLVVGLGNGLDASSRTPLIWFMVLFPTLVLIVFAWLVSQHHDKLYSPGDYGAGEFLLLQTFKSLSVQNSPELLAQIVQNIDPRTHDVVEITPADDTDPTVTVGDVNEAPASPTEEAQERSELDDVLASITSSQREERH